MDRLEAMSMLIAVTEHGSLSAASRTLQVPLATLSRKISDLESLLGTRLLIRTTRKLTLTDAGVSYIEAARRILEQVTEAERQASGEFVAPKGELVITAPVMFGRLHVLPLVVDFLEQFPEISVRLLLSDRNVDLVNDHVDMAVRIGRLPDSSMIATSVGSMRTVTCASPGLIARYGQVNSPEDLASLPCITLEAPMPTYCWRYRHPQNNQPLEIAIQSRLTVTTTEVAVQAAIRGVGVARLLHYQVVDAVGRGELNMLLAQYEPEIVPVHLIHASRGQMPLKMRRFLDFAAPQLREQLRRIVGRAD
ncbi:LysR family transcriptional regulator [Izhakiella australiensis]|uniref:LysR family transcriptional regulator n=1 Tax=Izhakiella australiensis TaxID=1926881 RepID=A0A1S8YG67_9GAMM|nr:LysR family transcriptional regulator [Izhakiella australiensis]OON38070.1 LysR family transcriptional regulator [Izhakiella australiensis]